MKQVPLVLFTSIALAFSAGVVHAQQSPAPGTPQEQPAPAMPAPTPANAKQVAQCSGIATSIAQSLQKDDFDGATKQFDGELKQMLSASKLKQGWDSLVAKYGKPQNIGTTKKGQRVNNYTVVVLPMQFEKEHMGAQVVCGDDGKVAGLRIGVLPQAGSQS